MNTHADKTKENKSQSVANALSQKQSSEDTPFQFVDNRPEMIAQRKLQELTNNSSLHQQNPIQRQASPESSRRENNTGLPDTLKTGIENLSGYSMDDVKVHYNSEKPAQLQAHAYAQGTDIHLGSGQEKHLPHEAWHVVQQKQGRVQPTMQMKGKVNINDDEGLEKEADEMGAMAINDGNTSTMQMYKSNPKLNVETVQFEREYDSTLSSDKGLLMEWLIDTNKTLGISEKGEDKTGSSEGKTKNKKSNFSWHHIAAFADLKAHGEKKTDPSNHGGNLRLGPMKNRSEATDVSGGTALDYGYLPLDDSGEIVLDDYSKKLFDETIKVSNKGQMEGALPSLTHGTTPQTKGLSKGDDATSSFSEWFMDTEKQKELLSSDAILGKLAGTKEGDRPAFIAAINKQLDSLKRTYKYYNKKKKIQVTSGVPMTDISEGKFGHITIAKGDAVVKASTIIDALLRNEEWVSRGSQGEVQDVDTTYKFGLSKYPEFTKMIEGIVATVDLSTYEAAKVTAFRKGVADAFKDVMEDKQSDDTFSQAKENRLVGLLVDEFKKGKDTYDDLWAAIDGTEIGGQYVKADDDDEADNWELPVPSDEEQLKIITTTKASKPGEHHEIKNAWAELFSDKLEDWDGQQSLVMEGLDASDQMFIDFDDVEENIESHDDWDINEINEERRENGCASLPKAFISSLTLDVVRTQIAHVIDEDPSAYLSEDKVDLTRDEVKADGTLKNLISGVLNVNSKRIKGVEKDFGKRKIAFGANLEGYINTVKWNLINSNSLPTDVDGLDDKKWEDLGGELQTTYYTKWITQRDIVKKAKGLVKSEDLENYLP